MKRCVDISIDEFVRRNKHQLSTGVLLFPTALLTRSICNCISPGMGVLYAGAALMGGENAFSNCFRITDGVDDYKRQRSAYLLSWRSDRSVWTCCSATATTEAYHGASLLSAGSSEPRPCRASAALRRLLPIDWLRYTRTNRSKIALYVRSIWTVLYILISVALPKS